MNGPSATFSENKGFRRQFLLTAVASGRFPSWNRTVIAGRFHIYAHPDLEMTRVDEDDRQLVLLGFMIDPDHPEQTNSDILRRLIGGGNDLRLLFERTSAFSGRWILVAADRSRTILFNDAAGLRSVYFTKRRTEPLICASQPGLMALLRRHRYSSLGTAFIGSSYYRRNKEYWWPGGTSLYEGVTHLLPNHFLDLENREIVRFWPREPIHPMPLDAAVEKAADRLKKLVESGARRFDLALPLTAGLDSRTLLAATAGPRDNIYYYTLKYWGLEEKSPDIRIPRRLASALGFAHHLINCSAPMDAAFRNVYMENVADAHTAWGDIAFGLSRGYPTGRVCLKGNVSEIARSSVYFNIRYPRVINGRVLAELAGMPDLPGAAIVFDEWFRRTRPIAGDCRVDILDLFYWEHKMGVWQAMSQLEWDIVQETYTPFNCRELLGILLAVDIRYRKETRYVLYERIIQALWPEVLREPVNPEPFKAVRHSLKMALKQIGFDQLMKKTI